MKRNIDADTKKYRLTYSDHKKMASNIELIKTKLFGRMIVYDKSSYQYKIIKKTINNLQDAEYGLYKILNEQEKMNDSYIKKLSNEQIWKDGGEKDLNRLYLRTNISFN